MNKFKVGDKVVVSEKACPEIGDYKNFFKTKYLSGVIEKIDSPEEYDGFPYLVRYPNGWSSWCDEAGLELANPFEEYKEWLVNGGDLATVENCDYDKCTDGTYKYFFYRLYLGTNCIRVWNGGMRGSCNRENGEIEIPNCTQDHNCIDHDHLEYFKEVIQSKIRRKKLKELTGV